MHAAAQDRRSIAAAWVPAFCVRECVGDAQPWSYLTPTPAVATSSLCCCVCLGVSVGLLIGVWVAAWDAGGVLVCGPWRLALHAQATRCHTA
jgi:hypothetical protein